MPGLDHGKQQKATILALVAVLFWSTVPTAFKLGLRYQDNFQMLTGAALVSTLVLGIIMLATGRARHLRDIERRDLLRAGLLGLLNPAIYYLVLFKAYDLLPGQVAQPLNMIWPIVLVLISAPLLKQKITWKSILAMVISFAGVLVLSFQGGAIFNEGSSLKGVILAILTSVLWSFYWIFNMKTKLEEVTGLFLVFAWGSIFLLLAGIFRKPFLPQGQEAWSAAIYVGIFEMGLTFFLWLRALQLSSTTARISNFVFIAPFLNLFFVRTFLHEEIFISTIFGIILVVCGIIIQNTRRYKNE